MSTIYQLPAGCHSVSARGREFTGDADGRIDLKDVDGGTIADLMAYAGVTLPLTDEQKAAIKADAASAAEIIRAADEHRAAALASEAPAEIPPAERDANERAATAATREADAAVATSGAAVLAATDYTQVAAAGLSQQDQDEADPAADPASRGVTPPRRKRPSNG